MSPTLLLNLSQANVSQVRKTPAVGIDLGTTYSAVAIIDEYGRPVTLSNAEGEKLTPSVLLFDDRNVVVGKEAVKAMGSEMEKVADSPKRDLGNRLYRKQLGGRAYPPETLQAWILNKLRIDTQEQIGPFEKVVITVPAYFDEVRRKATQDAGYMAGFEVIDIINEPTAAAVAYGLQQGFLNAQGVAENKQNILVYDLGGGTFDVTVMSIDGTEFRTLATDGDVSLGGRDWDQRLIDYVAEECIRSAGWDPRDEPNSEGRLWRECEEAKRTLTVRSKAQVTCHGNGRTVVVDIDRAEFDEMTQDLIERTAFTTKETLREAGLTWEQLDQIILVGGSTRMPCVREMLENISGKKPNSSLPPDEAVAAGAALRASILLDQSNGQAPRFSIRNVNSHSLGVVGVDPKSKRKLSGVLIARNTPLPASANRRFRTQKENQKSIMVQIVEGESQNPDDCTTLGQCVVKDLPANLPPRSQVNIRFRYQENGRLKVNVQVAGTDASIQHELTRENSLTKDQLDAWRQYITGLKPS